MLIPEKTIFIFSLINLHTISKLFTPPIIIVVSVGTSGRWCSAIKQYCQGTDSRQNTDYRLLDYRVTNKIYLSRNTSSVKLRNQAGPNETLFLRLALHVFRVVDR